MTTLHDQENVAQTHWQDDVSYKRRKNIQETILLQPFIEKNIYNWVFGKLKKYMPYTLQVLRLSPKFYSQLEIVHAKTPLLLACDLWSVSIRNISDYKQDAISFQKNETKTKGRTTYSSP